MTVNLYDFASVVLYCVLFVDRKMLILWSQLTQMQKRCHLTLNMSSCLHHK